MQALHTLLLRLALLDLQEHLIVITDEIVVLVGFLHIHQVHVGLGHIAFVGHKRLVVVTNLHEDLRFLTWGDDDAAESQSIHANRHLARQPKGNLYRHRAVVGKRKHLFKTLLPTQWCKAAHKEIQFHARLVAQHLHLDGGNALVDFGCRQRLVLRVLHILPLSRQHQFLFHLAVADVPETERPIDVTLREVQHLRVLRHRLEVERQMGYSALRYPEQRVGLQVGLFLVGLCTTRKGILLALGRLHKRLLGKANPPAREMAVTCNTVSASFSSTLVISNVELLAPMNAVGCSHTTSFILACPVNATRASRITVNRFFISFFIFRLQRYE